MRALPSPLMVVTDRLDPPPSAGEGGRGATGRGERDLSGEFNAPLSRPSLTRGPPSPAGGGGLALLATLEACLAGGARWVWFRERDMAAEPRAELARAVLAITRAAGAALNVGGDPDLAAAIGAEGAHLPGGATRDDIRRARDLLPDGLIGSSAHGLTDVERAARAGCDYVTLSPIFETASKPGYGPALGLGGLRAAAGIGVPVIALGGVTAANAGACREAGAAGVAVMGGVMRARDPRAAVRALLDGSGAAAADA